MDFRFKLQLVHFQITRIKINTFLQDLFLSNLTILKFMDSKKHFYRIKDLTIRSEIIFLYLRSEKSPALQNIY